MHLSKRLQMVANCVSNKSLVADVGCDHAYISIHLVENEIALHSIALDINEGPLRKAQENVKEYGYEDKIEVRLSNGLNKLSPGEVNSIVIAGMGGILMVQILSEGSQSVAMAKELILQPQSEVEKVREYLHNIGFGIRKEDMCIDDGKYYVVIHAINVHGSELEIREVGDNNKKCMESSRVIRERAHNKYGELLLKAKHPILEDFLRKEELKAKQILCSLKENLSEKNSVRSKEIEAELAMLKYAISYYE